MADILILFFKQVFAIVLSFTIGHVFLVLYKKQKIDYNFKYLFLNLFFAIMFFAIITAIVRTSFYTIWAIPILPTLWFIYKTFSRERISIELFMIKVKPEFLILFVLIILGSCYWYSFYLESINNFKFTETHTDLNCYANISKGIWVTGTENFYSSYFQYSSPVKLGFYHYLELWLNGFWYHVCGVSPYEALLFITYPICFILSILSIAMFIQYKIKNSFYCIITALIIATSLVYFDPRIFTHKIFQQDTYTGWTLISFYGQKLLITYPFAVLALYLYLNKKYFPLIIILFSLFISQASLLFFFGTTLGLLFLYIIKLTIDKKISISEFANYIILYLLFSIPFAIYLFTQNDQVGSEFSLRIFKQGMFNFILNAILFFLTGLPLIFLYSLFFRQLKGYFVFIGALLLSVFISMISASFIKNFDAFQFLYTILPFFWLILSLLLFHCIKEKHFKIYLIILLPFAILNIVKEIHDFPQKWYSRYNRIHSPEYIENCIHEFKNPDAKFIYIAGTPPLLSTLFPERSITFSSRFSNASDSYDISMYLNNDTITFPNKNDQDFLSPYTKWKLQTKFIGSNQIGLIYYMKANHIKYIFVNAKEKIPAPFLNNFFVCCKDLRSKDYLLKMK